MIEQPLVASQRLVPGRYRIDQTKTAVSLVATHLWGVKPVVASMQVIEGAVVVADDLAHSSVWVRLSAASFRSDHPRRDAHVVGTFLAAQQHPEITFSAQHAVLDQGRWTLPGTLLVQATSAPVTLELEVSGQPDGGLRVTATARLDRFACGVTAGRGIVNRWVDLTLDVVAAQPLMTQSQADR